MCHAGRVRARRRPPCLQFTACTVIGRSSYVPILRDCVTRMLGSGCICAYPMTIAIRHRCSALCIEHIEEMSGMRACAIQVSIIFHTLATLTEPTHNTRGLHSCSETNHTSTETHSQSRGDVTSSHTTTGASAYSQFRYLDSGCRPVEVEHVSFTRGRVG